jgi:hypothetical protein
MPMPLYENTSREYPGFNMNIPDQFRADAFIREVEQKYIKEAAPFPRFIFMHLPNDHMAQPRPEDGYPFSTSYVADNDYALGRIQLAVVEGDGGFRHGGRCARRAGPHRFAPHGADGGGTVHQARLCVARQFEFSRAAENDLPDTGNSAAESLRCDGIGPFGLLHLHTGLCTV